MSPDLDPGPMIQNVEPPLDPVRDRAVGLLTGLACGDALSAPYEFTPPPPTAPGAETTLVPLVGGGYGDGGTPGGWTSTTCLAASLAATMASGHDLDSDDGAEAFGMALLGWWRDSPPNCGPHTKEVLTRAQGDISQLAASAFAVFDETGGGSSQGALLRTAVVALLSPDRDKVARAADRIATLTHAHPDSIDACVLLAVACHDAVWVGKSGPMSGMNYIAEQRRTGWLRIGEAALRAKEPAGWAKGNRGAANAFAAAASALALHPDNPALAISASVLSGGDSARTAAITGAYTGAIRGLRELPTEWVSQLHGPVYLVDGSRREWTSAELRAAALYLIDRHQTPQ